MPIERSVDHIVIAVGNLDSAAARYEAIGFKLTPRASHPLNMGTSNRLVQFAGRNFIELLEVDRPGGVEDHDFDAVPPKFSFGAHNQEFLAGRNGISMMVLTSGDARADLKEYEALGLQTYAPFDFERKARLPDGSEVTVAFSLGFVTSPALPDLAFFVCQQPAPEYFWKPDYQAHGNGARSIVAIYLASEDPDAHVGFFTRLTGGALEEIDGGQRIAFGGQELLLMTPEAIRAVVPGFRADQVGAAEFAGLAISSTTMASGFVPADGACGLFIEWRSA